MLMRSARTATLNQNAMIAWASDGAADTPAGDSHVRHLGAHPDYQREIDKVPIIRLVRGAGKKEAANLSAGRAVVLVGVVEGEHGVHEEPRKHDGRDAEDQPPCGDRAFAAQADLGVDRDHARERGDRGEGKHDELADILSRGVTAYVLRVSGDHQVNDGHEKHDESDIPADQQRGDRP